MVKNKSLFLLAGLLLTGLISFAQVDTTGAYALIRRILPLQVDNFVVETLPATEGKDVFELEENHNRKVVLRGNNGVAIASALYYYLNEYCHFQITWNGTHVDFRPEEKLPVVPAKVHKTTPYEDRYYLNYCTFNYSMSWWDWSRWEKEIDWMALHGINMPLAITGEEYIWYSVYKEMGFTDEELQAFFSGPAYFSWFWMGNLDGWGGPLPVSWMKSHANLEQKILQRERELGMRPVLPAFTGHVPVSFRNHFPAARLKKTNWDNGFADTYILDPEDPLFASIAKKYLETQTHFFGTDHLYSADTFNENEPPSDDTSYLAGLSRKIYEGMQAADPASVWVMQGWLFYSDRKFWKAPQIKSLLDAVPNDHMLILDLASEIEPVWKRTEAFYGKPWIWNMLHNFGGNISMFGRMDIVATAPPLALHDSNSGRMKGIGLTMEAIEQTPILYELMTDQTWRDSVINLNKWLATYVRNRYGEANEKAIRAWQIIRTTAFNGKDIRDGAESIITGRPTFSASTVWTHTRLNYDPKDLLVAWDLFIDAAPSCHHSDGFQYDLVDITRQCMANYALALQEKWNQAYREKNSDNFANYSKQFLDLIYDMDQLLGSRQDFLLGPWIASARSWGSTEDEKNLYERNARDLITLWGDKNSPLHEYSCRQWSGLLSDFYAVRWKQFFQQVQEALSAGQQPDMSGFDSTIREWEWNWVNTRKDYPVKPTGNTVEIARSLYKKYREAMAKAYFKPKHLYQKE